MGKKIDIENFERFLKEVSDDFRIYPSKSIWSSIYNNMHPGKKLPSISVSILLFTTIIILGYLNTANNSTTAVFHKNYKSKDAILTSQKVLAVNRQINFNVKVNSISNSSYENPSKSFGASLQSLNASNYSSNMSRSSLNKSGIFPKKNNRKDGAMQYYEALNNTQTQEDIKQIGQIRKEQINDHKDDVKYYDQVIKKVANKLSWQIYASPSFTYTNMNEDLPGNNKFTKDLQSSQYGYNITGNKPSMGVEIGASMQYNFLKNLKITTGLQLNYSKYYLEANRYGNSVETANSSFTNSGNLPEKFFTNNNFYTTNLSKEMYQISIPVGVVYKIAGKDQLYWNVGATIQPTLLMSESDQSGDDLIKNASSLSKWNLNAGFETFVSYKIRGITWQLGPQFRYQLLSSFNKQNSFIENPYVYGLKLGISKPIK